MVIMKSSFAYYHSKQEKIYRKIHWEKCSILEETNYNGNKVSIRRNCMEENKLVMDLQNMSEIDNKGEGKSMHKNIKERTVWKHSTSDEDKNKPPN